MSAAPQEESKSLGFLLDSKVKEFFDEVWQKSCAIFRAPVTDAIGSATSVPNHDHYNPTEAADNPLRYLIASGISVTEHLLEHANEGNDMVPASGSRMTISTVDQVREPPLIFQNQSILSESERANKYDNSLWAALLDGCSVVVNHADEISPWIAALCEDLQLSLPHAYANVYITPAHQQAVDAHADDRDVLIIQLCGSKQWTVYTNVPIPLPYSDEQVGKSGLKVPEEVLNGTILIQKVLTPGEVLYLPRGYVHQATSGAHVSSHVTVALATHDWTMAGLLESASRHTWRNRLDLRMAMPREIGRKALTVEQRQRLADQLDAALYMLRSELSVDTIETTMRQKYERHNMRASILRTELIRKPIAIATSHRQLPTVTGPQASCHVSMECRLRPSSAEEKASVVGSGKGPTTQIGLHVHEEIFEDAMKLVSLLKSGCSLPLGDIETLCPLTVLAVSKRCVSLGALAIDHVTCERNGDI